MNNKQFETTFDLTIIGGGIIGAWILYLAKKRFPNWNILLVEASLVGNGTSRYSASLDMPGGHTPLRQRLVKSSQEYWNTLLSKHTELPIRDINAFGVCKKTEFLTIREHFSGTLLDDKRESHLKKLNGFLPEFDVTNNHSLFQIPFAKYATQNTIAESIISNFRWDEKCTIIEGIKITSVSKSENYLELTTKVGLLFRSKGVIEATGPWMLSGPVANQCSSLGIRTKKIVALHIEEKPHPEATVIYDFDKEAFLMPRHEEGRWLFSFRLEVWDVALNPESLKINSSDLSAAKKILYALYPRFVELISGGRSFCDAYGLNNDPVIKPISGLENYVIAGGGSGSGFRLAPGIASEALSLLKPL